MEKQSKFHISPASTRALFGGNRSGKTTSGGMEFLYHITGQYPDWYPKDQRFNGAIKGRIGAQDFQKGVGEVIIPFFEEWMDPGLVKRKVKNPMGIPVKWYMKNGSVFDILTYEQNTEQWEGWKGHIAWFDEPPPRNKYIATLRGMVDYHGRNWLTLTPLTQPWIYDDIYTKSDGKSVYVITTDIRDNSHLSELAIKEFEKQLTEEEKEARLHGRFLHLTGLIYKEFEPDIHIVPDIKIKPHWTRYMAIDPHPRMPTAVLWLAVDEKDNHYIYDELWLKDMDIKQVSQAIKVQQGVNPAHVSLIDPHADKEDSLAGGFNVRKELMRHGIFTQRGNSDTDLGKHRIRQALKLNYSALLKKDIPQLHISSYCKQTIFEFQHYIWDDHRRNKEEYSLKETAKKKNDHFMDCLRYIYNYQPRFIQEEIDDDEITYAGKYVKHAVKEPKKGSYHSLVEENMGTGKGGNF